MFCSFFDECNDGGDAAATPPTAGTPPPHPDGGTPSLQNNIP